MYACVRVCVCVCVRVCVCVFPRSSMTSKSLSDATGTVLIFCAFWLVGRDLINVIATPRMGEPGLRICRV